MSNEKNYEDSRSLNMETKVVHGFRGYDDKTGAVSFPIYQSATYRHPELYQTTGYDYSRLQNPTREELENTVASLENGKHGFAFSSGMAAISTVFKLFSPGSHIIVSDDLYGGTYRLFEAVYRNYGIEYSYVDTARPENIEYAIRPETKAVFVETPSNPTMKVTDISAAARIAKSKNCILIVDNTFLTPYFQRPLELGADLVVHSGTKFLGGHNDTLAGFIVMNCDETAERVRLIQKSEGAVLSPFDSWLMLRGIKTLGVRMEQQQKNAMQLVQWLKGNKRVNRVYYVGMPEHEGYEISLRQSSGFGAMISFEVESTELVAKILKGVKVIMFAESLGGVESLITYPMVQTHSAIPEDIRSRIGVNDRLLRLSVGIENINDLINDIDRAMRD
ncbi:MAG TPA: PLP-dependent aspartate aminotransferase family protein [Ruminiclostridium sp.]|nr:PLP-dependent aspartate aminotransferase family protein [Ruminiclostridium sp.]